VQSIPVQMNPLFANEEECRMYLSPEACQGVVSQINQKFQSLQQLLISLRDKLDTYQQMMEANNTQLAGTGADLDAVKAELVAGQAAAASARAEKEALDRQIAEQIARQGVADEALKQMRDDAAAREAQANTVQAELVAERDQLKKDYDTLIQDRENVAKTLGELQTKMATVLGTINTNLGSLEGQGQTIVDTYAVQYPAQPAQPQPPGSQELMVNGPIVPGTNLISQNPSQFDKRIARAMETRVYPDQIDNFTTQEYLKWYNEMGSDNIKQNPDIVAKNNQLWATKSGRGM